MISSAHRAALGVLRLRWRWPLLLLALVLGSGCVPIEDDTTPPFRVAPYGAGFAYGSVGRRVTLLNAEGEEVGKARVSHGGIRVYDEAMVRLGRVRASGDHYELLGRDGGWLCDIGVETDDAVFICEGGLGFTVSHEGQGWRLSPMPGDEEELVISGEDDWSALLGGHEVAGYSAAQDDFEASGAHFTVRGRISRPAAMLMLMPAPDGWDDTLDWRLLRGAIAWSMHRLEGL